MARNQRQVESSLGVVIGPRTILQARSPLLATPPCGLVLAIIKKIGHRQVLRRDHPGKVLANPGFNSKAGNPFPDTLICLPHPVGEAERPQRYL